MQRVLTWVAAAAIVWLAGIEILLDGRRSAAEARLAVELAAETTRARAVSLLEARAATLRGEIAKLERNATPSGEVVSTLGSLMNGSRQVLLTDGAGRIIALSAGAPALSPATARSVLANPAVWTTNASSLLLALPMWTAREQLYVLTLEPTDRLIAQAAPADAAPGLSLAWAATGPETPAAGGDLGNFGLARFTSFVPWGEIAVKRPLGPSSGFIVASASPRLLLLQWLYHALMLALIAALLLLLVWFGARHGRRLTFRYLERLESLSRSSAEFIKLTDRGVLLRAVEKRANLLIPHARIRVIPADRAKLGAKLEFPIHQAAGGAAAYMIVESRRGPLGKTDAAMLGELAHRASGALDNIDLLESRDRAVAAAESHLHDVEEAKRKIEVIFAAMSDAVLALDAGMRVSYANRNTDALFGKSREALIGCPLESFWPAESLETLTASIAGAAMGGTVSFRSIWPMQQGAPAKGWVSVRVFPYEDGFAVYLNEITGQVESEGKALQTTRAEAIGHLTGGVAHDFNNLLTVVLGNLELATLETLAPEVETLLLEAHHAADSAADLVRQLLAFARRQPLAPKVVDVGVLTAGVAGMLRRTLGATIAVEVQFSDTPRAVVDPNQLETAILNLAVNARDAMPAGGRLSIELDGVSLAPVEAADLDVPPGDYVRLKVADTGAGIAPAHLPKIFDPFFTTKPVGRGTGLGLSMVYGFVKQSGGAISVASQPGSGTAFTLLLPAEAPVPADAGQPVLPEIAELPTGTETILLVEDSLQVRSFACACLRGLGYAIVDFGDAASALAAVAHGLVPDMLLSDVVLPGGTDGTALAQILQRKLPHLPVLFMSAYADLETVVNQRLCPGENLLPKPFRRDELAHRVRNCINHAQFGESDYATA
jgi:signal transduction histidine kinase